MSAYRTFIPTTLLVLSLNSHASAIHSDNGQAFQGIWKNQRGSTLELGNVNAIRPAGQNLIEGVFHAAVTVTPECVDYPLPVLATYNGNAIAMMINFQPCGSPSVVSISGYLTEDGQLETHWIARKKGPDTVSAWFFNRDVYTRETNAN
ncbi:avidin/streptavidin family protein [Kistimonas asteriae]|uniref:avidin/streptavidin family protein n=1 Tax=Kistimonas asteriae TaxID=517724 RepID=UPI001BACFFF1|nr:avidin/streptavidin family protein [Kistimonas asteriae]